jgi:hypothetical protein
VQIAGVLLVFCYLVAPAVFAVMFFDDLKRRLITGWTMATLVSAVGLLFSYDRPSGPTIMVCFAAALVIGATLKAIAQAPSRSRAVAFTAASLFLVAGAGWALYHFRPGAAVHSPETETAAIGASTGAGSQEAGSPEHPLGSGVEELRAALRDTHENVRARAVEQLASGGDPRIMPDIVAALHDQSPAVREAAAAALARLGDRSALPALKQGLRNADEDEWVRLRIAQAIVGLGDGDGVPVLLDLARNADGKVTRLEALSSLARLAELPGPAPADPDSAEGTALVEKVDRWWKASGEHLK